MIFLQFASIILAFLSIPNNIWRIGHLQISIACNVIGICLLFIGLSIRIFSMNKLGKYYSTLLFTNEDHKLITTGIYKYIRHPIYLGDMLFYFGIGISLSNYIIILVLLLSSSTAYIIRMNQEEKMMIEGFGNEYVVYCSKTKRLIPFLY